MWSFILLVAIEFLIVYAITYLCFKKYNKRIAKKQYSLYHEDILKMANALENSLITVGYADVPLNLYFKLLTALRIIRVEQKDLESRHTRKVIKHLHNDLKADTHIAELLELATQYKFDEIDTKLIANHSQLTESFEKLIGDYSTQIFVKDREYGVVRKVSDFWTRMNTLNYVVLIVIVVVPTVLGIAFAMKLPLDFNVNVALWSAIYGTAFTYAALRLWDLETHRMKWINATVEGIVERI